MPRGGFLHNHVLLGEVAELLSGYQARLRFEHPVRKEGRTVGFIDLFAIVEDRRLAIEAECSTQRVGNDIKKAKALGVDLLVIVMPNRELARRVQGIVRAPSGKRDRCESFEIWILPLGLAIKRLRDRCELLTSSLATRSSSHQPHPRPEKDERYSPGPPTADGNLDNRGTHPNGV